MTDENLQTQNVSTQPVQQNVQPIAKNAHPQSVINPMKAATPPQMPTKLEFAEKQATNITKEDKPE